MRCKFIAQHRIATVWVATTSLVMMLSCANSEFASSGNATTQNKDKNKKIADDDEDDNEAEKKSSSKKKTDENDSDLASNKEDNDSDLDIQTRQDDDILVSDESLSCDKGKPGLVGKLYQLPTNTERLPDFKTMTPLGQVESLQLNVPTRNWTSGFPGVPNLDEWFAIEFLAALEVQTEGSYVFRTLSDDGSRLFIDDSLVVDNDGKHAPESKSGSKQLSKGKHKIKVEWFQGPRKQIALQVFWTKPGGSEEIIPAEVLTRNKDCKLQDLGVFE